MLTTTLDTIAQRRLNIKFSELPKTFQDAVHITRALGLRYLWIDSLCIIQDDKRDWEIESAKMAGIYTGSYLTIAATASADSSGGFFFNRWVSDKTFGKLKVETFKGVLVSGGADITVYVRPTLNCSHRTSGDETEVEFDNSPLITRAWACQERLLSPRTLHVLRDEMLWECRICGICECGFLNREKAHSGGFSSTGGVSSDKSRMAMAVYSATDTADYTADSACRFWFSIVENYSRLALTKESDRLPALSGLATFFSQQFKTRYLAGLWESHLAEGLLWWRIDHLEVPCYQDKSSPLPSWSWASIVRRRLDASRTSPKLHLHYNIFEVFEKDHRLKILQANCEVAGANPFGEVSKAILSIEGALVIAVIELQLELTKASSQVSFGSASCKVYLDSFGPDEIVEVADGEMVSCILIGRIGVGENRCQGLLLKAVGLDTYRRVGFFELGQSPEGPDLFDGVSPTTVHLI